MKVKDSRLSLRINSEDKKKMQIIAIEKGFKNLSDYILFLFEKNVKGGE